MTAPITQDVLTIPRKAPEAGRMNLVGLTRARAARRADRGGHAGAAGRDARPDRSGSGSTRRACATSTSMTNLAKDYRAMLAEHFVIELPEVVTRQVSADGTRKYLVRIAGGHEVETVYIPEEGRGTLCVSQPGRLHADLLVLPHRHAAAGAQPDGGRDRRPDHAGARRPRRMAGAGPGAQGRDAASVQHRADGHGRAALQLRECARRDEDRDGRRGDQPLAAGASPCRPAASCPRSRAPPRRSAACWRCRSTPPPTRCATGWCRSTASGTSPSFWTRLRAYPKLSNSERITFEYVMLDGVNDSDDDARRLVEPDPRHPGQDQPDPVQRMARRALPAGRRTTASAPSPTSSTRPATPARSAPRAARTSWPPAGSSSPRASAPPASAARSRPRTPERPAVFRMMPSSA